MGSDIWNSTIYVVGCEVCRIIMCDVQPKLKISNKKLLLKKKITNVESAFEVFLCFFWNQKVIKRAKK